MEKYTGNAWNKVISTLPNPHFLQSIEWSRVKADYGWEALPFVWRSDDGQVVAAAMLLRRRIPVRGLGAKMSVLYAPKGPLLDWRDERLAVQVLSDLEQFAVLQGAIFIKLDPDVILGQGIPGGELSLEDDTGRSIQKTLLKRNWKYSSDQIQFRNTVLVDVSADEETLLARMKQKTRYNVRLAAKKGVTVRVGTSQDWSMLYKMYAETSVRDGFVIRDEQYYRSVWQTFLERSLDTHNPCAEALIAEVQGEAVAGIVVFYFAGRAYYVYGMSRDVHRDKMPTYLLQWEGIRRAKMKACHVYDLWGAPEVFDGSDPMWGVYRFKEGLGGEVMRTLGAYDFAPRRWLYSLYIDAMPRILDVMRNRGRSRTRQVLE